MSRDQSSVQTPDRPRRAARPDLPEDVDPAQLPPEVRRELRSLPAGLADTVARHLVAAGRALDEDAALALRHAAYAQSLAPRLAVLREAHGVAAYHAGEYAVALGELRAVRRMTGAADYLPVLADCERGLGRPERALTLASDPDVRNLDLAAQVELRIVVSGARRDLGEYDAAVVALQGPALDSPTLQPWSARLWYAYAEALLAAGRRDEAVQWFGAVAAIDEDQETDADDRLAELEEG